MHEYRSFLKDVFPKFIESMKISQHWSRTYAQQLSQFDGWLFNNHGSEEQLTQKMVDDYCAVRPTEIINSNLARTNVVIALIRYMQKRGLTDVKEPDRPSIQKCTHIPHAFTVEELINFFYVCDHIKITNSSKSIVIKLILCVIFRLMYCTGIRPNEARELKRENVDLKEGVLNIIQTKGHDQHYVAIHESLIDTLKEYDKRMNELIPDRVYFFPSGKDSFYRSGWLAKHFSELWKQANPNITAVSYDFRHNYATTNINSWIDEGFDFYDKLYYLSKSMGHCNVDSTKYYYSLVPQLADILEEKSGAGFDELVPEVIEDEIW